MKTLFVLVQYLVPQHLLSRVAGRLGDCGIRPLKNTLIRLFIARYRVDMGEALHPELDAHATFNEFFTRRLKTGSRPLDTAADTVLCPADGTVSAIGGIESGSLLQAKGKSFSLRALLGGDGQHAESFDGGSFATIYLSPKDYHRVHMPLTGTLQEMIFIPGRLFSVNQTTCDRIPGLFARNERAVCLFNTDMGPMAVILVGAMIVAGIETAWAGRVAPAGREITVTDYLRQPPVVIEKGGEMGLFRAGSTVIVLFGPGAVGWEQSLHAQSAVRMGQRLGRIVSSSTNGQF